MRLESYDLTISQQRALERALGERAPGPWIITHALDGDLDIGRLRGAIASLAQRTTLFERSYVRTGRAWSMLVSTDIAPELAEFDMRRQPEDAALGLLMAIANQSYRPEIAPLARFSLIRREGSDLLVFTAAPWVIDSYSFHTLFRALSQAYAGDTAAQGSIDFDQVAAVEEERAFLASPAAPAARRYWLSLLRDRRTQVAPARWPDSTAQTRASWPIAPQRLEAVAEVAAGMGLHVPQVLHYALHLMLARMTGTESVVTALIRRPGMNAIETFAEDLSIGHLEGPGYFVSAPRADMRMRDYMLDSGRLASYSILHSWLPTEDLKRIIRETEPEFDRFTNVAALSDTLPYGALSLPGVETQLLPDLSNATGSSDIAVALSVGITPAITLSVRDPAIMASMRHWMDAFTYRVDHLAEDLDTEIGSLDWMSAGQRATMIDLAQGDPVESPYRTFLDRFLDQAVARPDDEAVRYDGASLTYRELLAAADALAERLRPLIADQADPLVGVCLPRGLGMIIAIIGIMRAGAGYVPLDPGNPPERLAYILSDSHASAVIADDETSPRLAEAEGLTIISPPSEEEWHPFVASAISKSQVDDARTAYVIYTSGTTGLPKGVIVQRGNLAAYLAATDGVCACGPGDRWMQFASINFDASVLEIANCLSRGAALVIASAATRTDPDAVAALLRDERITHAFIPPAMLRSLPREEFPQLTDVYVGGEASDDLTVAYWSRAVRLWNSYGPTETTVMCSAQRIGEQRSASDLGGPLPGYDMYVLDEQMRPVPFGATGEIWIGGPAVTRGYLGRPELTAEKFLPNPFGSGRVYRTGDLARHLPNGSLEYLGRNDFQVKIRGFRIELGDIESAIAAVPGVTGVYVTVIDTPGGKSLGAWFTVDEHGPDASAVSEAIAKQLPHYMVPPHLVRMDSFPVNISGKVDRTRLPMPGVDDEVVGVDLGPRERQVRAIWAESLGIDPDSMGAQSHFFHAGGHSLSAAVVCHTIADQLGIVVTPRVLFEHPTLADFCDSLGLAGGGVRLEPVVPTGTQQAVMPGSMPAMMFRRLAQYGADTAYTIVMRVEVDASVNPVSLRRALRDLLADDPVFRSRMSERSGIVEFTVDPETPINVELLADCDVEILAEEFRETAFDLTKAPLWRAAVILGEEGTTVLFAVHHAIFDGWSLNVMLEDLAARYDAMQADADFVREAPSMLDYGLWLDAHSTVRQEAIDYWQAKVAGAACRLELPTSTGVSRPLSNRELEMSIPRGVAEELRAWSSGIDVTLPPVLFTAYLIWLWRITGQRELVAAYPYAGRDVPGTERIFGMLVQMGFLRITLDPDEPIASLVSRVARQMIDDREHLIASPYDADLSASGAPNVLFSLQSGIGLEATYGSVTFSAHEYSSTSSKADIAAILYDAADGGLAGRFEYDASALDPDAIAPLVDCLTQIISSLASDPSTTVAGLPYLPEAQRTVIEAFSQGPELAEGPRTLVDAWRAATASHPDAIALVSAAGHWTYRDVDERTDRLAAHLVGQMSVKPQDLIGLSGAKSPELIMGALAILKAGAAYVPLDPHYPADRLAYILDDAGVRRVVADDAAAQTLSATGVDGLSFIDPYADYPEAATNLPLPDPRDLAYVIYTSGSTGRPKGVLIEHHTVPAMLRASAQMLDFDESSRMLLLGTLNFDASVIQVFLPLTHGGTLVVPAPDAERDPEGLHAFLVEQRVTHMVATPSLIRNLPRRPLPDMRLMGFGGEAIDAATAAYWCEQTGFWSLYGPTETTVMCSAGRILPGANSRIIGTPLGGYSLHLVNDLLQPVPLGAAGEILIGGGAARGYLGRPELTLERFVVDPTGARPNDIDYRSGDVGRFLPDGTIEYLGRNDDQIKLRGFRIELGEIETALQQAPGVEQAAAMVRGEGDLRMLVGYVTGPADLDLDAVRAAAAQVLPDYMVPSIIVRIDVLPLNANGKLDRKALPDITYTSHSDPPHEGIERDIAAIWEELLRVKGVGREDDFFRAGGNSLLAARLQMLLRERLGIDITTATLYAAPTIAALAGQGEDHAIADAVRTAKAGLTLDAPVAPRVPWQGRPTALLTGASGFLGIYLLADLLEQCDRVTCLMRGSDVDKAREVLAAQAAVAGLDIDLDRVRIVLGDLAAEGLGLEADTAATLADETDLIVHCGAWVHHLYSYTTLRTSNVDATADLIRLALTGARRSSLCFVSTESAAAALVGITEVAEDVLDPADHPPASDSGYLLTKWVAEELVADAAREYGLDAVIARPGNITGDSRTGFSNYASNHFWLFTKSCLQLGMVPDLADGIEMTPVDVLARAITALALHPEPGLRVANLSNPVGESWADFVGTVANIVGRPVEVVDATRWQAALMAADDDNALASLKSLYAGPVEGASPPVRRERTQQSLHSLGVATTADLDALTSLYADYLRAQGFWPA